MVIPSAGCATGFTRCAVCKIDLKGRFVYIDEEIESILQYTKEELFGRSIAEFLDESSQERIQELLSQRNHYETFFDKTEITIVNREGSLISARAIVSLNFIAGNPVNFQLICDTTDSESASDSPSTDTDPADTLIQNLAVVEDFSDLKALCEQLRAYTRALQVSIYVWDGETLEPRAGATDSNNAEFAFRSIPETNELHQVIASEGDEYNFTHEVSVQRAVELIGSPPSEYIRCFGDQFSEQYLIRFQWHDELASDLAIEAVQRARCGVEIAARLLAPTPREEGAGEGDADLNVKFTVGFLDSIGVGAALMRYDGLIIGYNPSMVSLLDGTPPGEDYHQFLDTLATTTRSKRIETIKAVIEGADLAELGIDGRFSVKGSSENPCTLVVVRFGDSPEDHTSCLVLIPANRRQPLKAAASADSIKSGLDIVQSRLSLIQSESDKICHEFHGDLGEDGNRRLAQTAKSSRELSGMISDLALMTALEDCLSRPSTTDLTLLLEEIVEEAGHRHSSVQVNLEIGETPKLCCRRDALRQIMATIVDNSFKFCGSQELSLSVECEKHNSQYLIEIRDDGPGIPTQYLDHVFDFGFRIPGRQPISPPGNGRCLAIAQCLARMLGGKIEADSDGKSGTSFLISIPEEQDCD